jgi:hypothetical protein
VSEECSLLLHTLLIQRSILVLSSNLRLRFPSGLVVFRLSSVCDFLPPVLHVHTSHPPRVYHTNNIWSAVKIRKTCFNNQLNAQFLYSITICMLHYNPRHVSSINIHPPLQEDKLYYHSIWYRHSLYSTAQYAGWELTVCSHLAYCTVLYRDGRYQML